MAREEKWRPVVDLEGTYEVSSLGRVRSLDRIVESPHPNGKIVAKRRKGVMLRLREDRDGYQLCTLQDGSSQRRGRVHHLVCEAFHGPRPENCDQVAHWDGDKRNNAPDNLRWATAAENTKDKMRHGTHLTREKHPNAKIGLAEARAIVERRRDGETYASIAAAYNMSISGIFDITRGKNWPEAQSG